jgi:hypothetical protein
MKMTTVYGIIGLDYVSGDHGCREYPVPLPHRYCRARVYDHEGERKRFPSLARESCPADYRNRAHPRFSCYGLVLWMVGTLMHVVARGLVS